MRFQGFELGGPTQDENTIRHFRNQMIETGSLKRVMKAFDWQLRKKGYIATPGRLSMPALTQHRSSGIPMGRRRPIKEGKTAAEIWPDDAAKAGQKDVDARWILKNCGNVQHKPDGTPLPQIAAPVFGYKSHINIDRRFGFIRQAMVTSAAAPDGRQLKVLLTTDNLNSKAWADSAYRSMKNETWLAGRMLTSWIHLRKPVAKPMPRSRARANAKKSSIRAAVEYVFAHHKVRFGLFFRI